MASNGTDLLPGQSPPLTIITSTNQSGIVLIATALGLIFALISILIRVFIRLEFRTEFARDDIIAAVSMVFAVFQSTAVFVEVSKGFGKTITEISLISLLQLQKASYASDILYIITLWLTKCSVAFLFLRLSPNKGHNLTSYAILVASTVLMVISVFIVALRCDLSHPWIFINAQCANLFVRWQVVAAFDIITEVLLFSTSIYMVKSLQLSLSKKSVVILAFGLRLPIVIPVALRLYYLNIEFSSSDPTLHGVLASVCTQIEISYAIIAATTPCLRPFMTALATNYGAPAKAKSSPSVPGTAQSKSNNGYSLSSLSKRSKIDRTPQVSGVPQTRWDQAEHRSVVVSGDQHSMESHESRQMIISKNTAWAVEYEGQDRATS